MIELSLYFLGGLLGAAHCVGMCGGFALAVGLGKRSPGASLARQLIYGCGRVFSYAFLGAAAGYAGVWFAHRAGTLVDLQAGLSLLAGGLLVVQGLRALGAFRRRGTVKSQGGGQGPDGVAPSRTDLLSLPVLQPPPGCAARQTAPAPPDPPSGSCSLVDAFLGSPRWTDVFLAGMLNGLLPCGLVYGYLALASTTASVPRGMATMLAFGLGTVPVMVLTGVGASLFSHAARNGLFRAAAVCVLLTGLLAIGRGLAFVGQGKAGPPPCPACTQAVVTHAATTPPILRVYAVSHAGP